MPPFLLLLGKYITKLQQNMKQAKQTNRYIDKWNRIEQLEAHLYFYNQLIQMRMLRTHCMTIFKNVVRKNVFTQRTKPLSCFLPVIKTAQNVLAMFKTWNSKTIEEVSGHQKRCFLLTRNLPQNNWKYTKLNQNKRHLFWKLMTDEETTYR